MQPPRGEYRRSFIVREALRVAPAKLNVAAGLRAALATTAPLLLSSVIGRPELAFAGLAGFVVVLADKGGAYRIRALSMSAMTLAGTLVTLLGTLSATLPWVAVPLVLVVVGLGGFARLFGAEATSVGTLTSVALVVALARPAADVSGAFASAGFFLAGCSWSALISLVLWPLRMYRPARIAIAQALRELARVAASFVGASDQADAQVKRRTQLGLARQALEAGRVALGSSRRGRPGPSRRGEQLVALLEAADQLFFMLTALEDGLALESAESLAGWVDEVASLTEHELSRAADALVEERLAAAPGSVLALRRALEPQARAEHVPRILLRTLDRLERTVELARLIDDPNAPSQPSRAEPSDLSSEASKRSLVRDHLTLDSAMFRHALRMAIATALVSLSTHALRVEHGYWATVTCLVIMQPHGAATWAKALQRVLGTVLGAAIALLVASFVHEPPLILAFVFAFVTLGMALLPLNYGAFAVCLTPAFVLLAETHAGELDLASVRIVHTLFGAGVALLGSRLLFPLSERDQFRPLMAKALIHVRMLLDVVAESPVSHALLRARRRELGLALLNAEASYQRLLTESSVSPNESEALLALLLSAHRLSSGFIALAVGEGTASHRELVERAPELAAALGELADAAQSRRPPAALLIAADEAGGDEAVPDRVALLFSQLEVLRQALLRWNA